MLERSSAWDGTPEEFQPRTGEATPTDERPMVSLRCPFGIPSPLPSTP